MIYESKNFHAELRFAATRLKVYVFHRVYTIIYMRIKVCSSARTLNDKIYLA